MKDREEEIVNIAESIFKAKVESGDITILDLNTELAEDLILKAELTYESNEQEKSDNLYELREQEI